MGAAPSLRGRRAGTLLAAISGPFLHALRPEPADGPEVVWLGDPRASDAALTGGKAANLSRLAGAHRVPPGFVVTMPGTTADRAIRAAVRLAYRRLAVLTGIDEPLASAHTRILLKLAPAERCFT